VKAERARAIWDPALKEGAEGFTFRCERRLRRIQFSQNSRLVTWAAVGSPPSQEGIAKGKDPSQEAPQARAPGRSLPTVFEDFETHYYVESQVMRVTAWGAGAATKPTLQTGPGILADDGLDDAEGRVGAGTPLRAAAGGGRIAVGQQRARGRAA